MQDGSFYPVAPGQPTAMDRFGKELGQTARKIRTDSNRRLKRGECPTCGNKTHKVNALTRKRTPLTIEGLVVYGQCLKCNPIEGYTRRPERPHIPETIEATRARGVQPEDDNQTLVSGLTMDQSFVRRRNGANAESEGDATSEDEEQQGAPRVPRTNHRSGGVPAPRGGPRRHVNRHEHYEEDIPEEYEDEGMRRGGGRHYSEDPRDMRGPRRRGDRDRHDLDMHDVRHNHYDLDHDGEEELYEQEAPRRYRNNRGGRGSFGPGTQYDVYPDPEPPRRTVSAPDNDRFARPSSRAGSNRMRPGASYPSVNGYEDDDDHVNGDDGRGYSSRDRFNASRNTPTYPSVTPNSSGRGDRPSDILASPLGTPRSGARTPTSGANRGKLRVQNSMNSFSTGTSATRPVSDFSGPSQTGRQDFNSSFPSRRESDMDPADLEDDEPPRRTFPRLEDRGLPPPPYANQSDNTMNRTDSGSPADSPKRSSTPTHDSGSGRLGLLTAPYRGVSSRVGKNRGGRQPQHNPDPPMRAVSPNKMTKGRMTGSPRDASSRASKGSSASSASADRRKKQQKQLQEKRLQEEKRQQEEKVRQQEEEKLRQQQVEREKAEQDKLRREKEAKENKEAVKDAADKVQKLFKRFSDRSIMSAGPDEVGFGRLAWHNPGQTDGSKRSVTSLPERRWYSSEMSDGKVTARPPGVESVEEEKEDEVGDTAMEGRSTISDIPMIIKCLEVHRDHPLVNERAIEALCDLATRPDPAAKVTILVNNGVECIIQGMWAHMDVAQVQVSAFSAMWALASTDGSVDVGEILARSANLGVVDAIVIAMQTHSSHATVQQTGCGAICCMASAAAESGKPFMDAGTASGALMTIANAMENHPNTDDVLEWGIRALYAICSESDSHMVAFANSSDVSEKFRGGGLDVVSFSMQNTTTELPIQEWACRLCHTLSSNERVAGVMAVTVEPVQCIVDAMDEHAQLPEALDLQIAACGALANMAVLVEQNNAHIRKAGGIHAIHEAMVFFEESEDLQLEACSAFANLAVTAESRNAIIEAGGVASVLVALQAFPDNETLQEAGLRAFRAFCVDSDDAKTLVSSDASLSAIVGALNAHRRSVVVQEMACAVIASLAVDVPNQVAIVSAGAIPAITEAMLSHGRERRLQEICCLALRNLSSNIDNLESLLASEAVSSVVRSMHAHQSSEPIQVYACCMIWNLGADCSHDLSILVEAGAVKYAIKAMQSMPESSSVQEMACGALWSLASASAELKHSVDDAGGVDAVVCAVVMYQHEIRVLENAIGVLSTLSVLRKNARRISTSGGIGAVVEAMRQNVSSPTLLETSSLLLRNLAVVHVDYADEASASVATILRGMKQHPDCAPLQKEACGALWALSAHSTTCKERILVLDGLDVITETMQRNKRVPEVQSEARAVFAILVDR